MDTQKFLSFEPDNLTDLYTESRFSKLFDNSIQLEDDDILEQCLPRHVMSFIDDDTQEESKQSQNSFFFEQYINEFQSSQFTPGANKEEGRISQPNTKLNLAGSTFIAKELMERIKWNSVIGYRETIGWHCSCAFFNFDSIQNCIRCGKVKQGFLFKSIDELKEEKRRQFKEKKKIPRRDGDWFCVECRNLNFAYRKVCNICKQSRDLIGVDCASQSIPGK